jgi:hypothetical protein
LILRRDGQDQVGQLTRRPGCLACSRVHPPVGGESWRACSSPRMRS